MALEPIFEADFLRSSHGFRQGRSPHTALRAVARRIADGKVLSLVSAFLTAGYMENWQYYRTYSGTPQGGILSPLLCNIFLHQLDEYMESLGANRVQTKKEESQRMSAKYRKVSSAIFRARRNLGGNLDRQARRELLATLEKLEKEQRTTPLYDERHHTKLGYVRYADDFVILVNGTKEEAIDYKNKVEGHLAAMGLTLSEEKTSITHWTKPIRFLGYDIHGVQRAKGVQIRAILTIPKEKERLIRRELLKTASYHHIPEIDAMLSMNAKFRGWCNYYKYANNPQEVFERISRKMWWCYAHFLARKHGESMKALLIRA